jgi:hypothetical protein
MAEVQVLQEQKLATGLSRTRPGLAGLSESFARHRSMLNIDLLSSAIAQDTSES